MRQARPMGEHQGSKEVLGGELVHHTGGRHARLQPVWA